MRTETAPSLLSQPLNSPNFLYWIAFDKHTETGRDIISKAAENLQIDVHLAGKLFFFLEGAQCNKITASALLGFGSRMEDEKTRYTND